MLQALQFRRLDTLDDARRAASPGARLEAIRRAAPRLRDAIGDSGKPDAVRTFDLATFPYPTQFGLGGAASSLLPFVMMRNRMQIVQWLDAGGARRTLLVNPTDTERSLAAPFFAKQVERYGEFVTRRVMSTVHGSAAGALAAAGVAADDVDYVTFDHLHVQDVRGLLGTADGGIRGLLSRAKLLVQPEELALFGCLHPLQATWYVRDGIAGIAPDRFVSLGHDVLLGPGVALVRTPGHTAGNHSIVLHTNDGIWTISENGIAVDSYAPESSHLRGLRAHARAYEVEVILNGNTREGTLDQYTSMILERTLADPCRKRPEFPNHFPSSELTAHPLAPGLAPTYSHGAITHGAIVPSRSHPHPHGASPSATPRPGTPSAA